MEAERRPGDLKCLMKCDDITIGPAEERLQDVNGGSLHKPYTVVFSGRFLNDLNLIEKFPV
jgi:hypothetical protein